MRKHILWVILLFITSLTPAQSLITGRVISTDKAGVTGINILAHPKDNPDHPIAYSFTDEQGSFLIEIKSQEDSLGISVKSLTHRDTTVNIANLSQILDFILPTQSHEIREFTVNAPAIIGRKDTLTYLVSKFAQAKDQSIGEVIGRIPGFEVTPDGQVLYQGSPIQKYYIEGLDLLENRYSIANKNLPYSDVGTVEVLENHQPVKALEKKVFSNQTSINLKLKKNITTTGTLQAGTGLPLLLRQVNLTPMLFGKKQQIVASLQSNNSGEDLNEQYQPMQFSGDLPSDAATWKPNLLVVTGIAKPQIDRKRYLNNNANLLSYNHLFKVNDQTELKVNAAFYRDHQKEKGGITYIYHLPDSNFSLIESTQNDYFNTRLSTNLTLTQNVARKYLKEQFKFLRYWDTEIGSIENPKVQNQKAETPCISVLNSLDILLPVGNQLIRFYSLFSLNNSPQKMTYNPGIFRAYLNQGQAYDETVQKYTKNEFSGQQFLRFTLIHKRWTFDTEPGFNFNIQSHLTSIQRDNIQLVADSLNNDFRWSNTELYLTEKIHYKKENFRLGLDLPLRTIFYSLKDAIHQSIEPNQRLLFSPLFWIDYDFQKYWSVSSSVRQSSRLGDASQLTQGYILQGYRSMQRRSAKLDDRETILGKFELEYKNPVSGFFSVATWAYNQTKRSLIYQNRHAGSALFFYDALQSENRAISNSFTFSNGLILSSAKVNLAMKGHYLATKYEYLLNQYRGWIYNHLLVIQPSIGINCLKNIGMDYNFKFSRITKLNMQSTNTILGLVHKFSFYYYPSPTHWIGSDIEYYDFGEKLRKGAGSLFANLGYTYKPTTSRMEFRLRCNNMFNSHEIVDYSGNDIALFKNRYSIRPREILLTVSFAMNRLKNKK